MIIPSEPCHLCGAKWDCLCKCRERIRLVAAEIDAALAVVDLARDCAQDSEPMRRALATYDNAVAARAGAP